MYRRVQYILYSSVMIIVQYCKDGRCSTVGTYLWGVGAVQKHCNVTVWYNTVRYFWRRVVDAVLSGTVPPGHHFLRL